MQNTNWYLNFPSSTQTGVPGVQKINQNILTQAKKQNNNSSNADNTSKKEDDVLLKYPARGLAYFNEIGEAIRPLGDKLAYSMWIPSLLYIGADVWDKYLRDGKNDPSQIKPDKKRAAKEATFQALASVILPTVSIKVAQKAAYAVKNVISQDFQQNVKNKMSQIKPLNKAILKLGGYSKVYGAVVGLSTLCAVVKPIDKFVEHVVMEKFVNPMLDGKKESK